MLILFRERIWWVIIFQKHKNLCPCIQIWLISLNKVFSCLRLDLMIQVNSYQSKAIKISWDMSYNGHTYTVYLFKRFCVRFQEQQYCSIQCSLIMLCLVSRNIKIKNYLRWSAIPNSCPAQGVITKCKHMLGDWMGRREKYKMWCDILNYVLPTMVNNGYLKQLIWRARTKLIRGECYPNHHTFVGSNYR